MPSILPASTPTQDDTDHALYRFFGSEGELLYVGISLHPFARMSQHRGDKSWWGEVASTTIERFPSRPAVLEAEREAIKSERPRYNIVHAGASRKSTPKPKVHFRYTYWEPQAGGVVTVYNVLPIHPGALLLTCGRCHLNYIGRDITDHGGDDFLILGICDCGQRQTEHIPRANPWGEHLSEVRPYAIYKGV